MEDVWAALHTERRARWVDSKREKQGLAALLQFPTGSCPLDTVAYQVGSGIFSSFDLCRLVPFKNARRPHPRGPTAQHHTTLHGRIKLLLLHAPETSAVARKRVRRSRGTAIVVGMPPPAWKLSVFSHSTSAGRFQAGRLPDVATASGGRLLPLIGPVFALKSEV